MDPFYFLFKHIIYINVSIKGKYFKKIQIKIKQYVYYVVKLWYTLKRYLFRKGVSL